MKITLENVNPDKLSDEFIKNNIEVISVLSDLKEGEYVAKNVEFELGADSNLDLINNIVENHDLTPIPPTPTEIDLLKEELANTNAMLLDMMELILGGI